MSYVRTYLCIYVHSVNTRNAPNTINEYTHILVYWTSILGIHTNQECKKVVCETNITFTAFAICWQLEPRQAVAPSSFIAEMFTPSIVDSAIVCSTKRKVHSTCMYMGIVPAICTTDIREIDIQPHFSKQFEYTLISIFTVVSWLKGGWRKKLCIHKPCSAGQWCSKDHQISGLIEWKQGRKLLNTFALDVICMSYETIKCVHSTRHDCLSWTTPGYCYNMYYSLSTCVRCTSLTYNLTRLLIDVEHLTSPTRTGGASFEIDTDLVTATIIPFTLVNIYTMTTS